MFKEEAAAAPTEKANATEEAKTETSEVKQPKKRGRKPGSKNKSTLAREAMEAQKKAEEEKNTEAQEVVVPAAEDDMELPPLDLKGGDDFVPIEDLPSEKFEIPSELLGKFEATKVEPPTLPAKEQKTRNSNRANNGRITIGTITARTLTIIRTTIITIPRLHRRKHRQTNPPQLRNLPNRLKRFTNLTIS